MCYYVNKDGKAYRDHGHDGNAAIGGIGSTSRPMKQNTRKVFLEAFYWSLPLSLYI